LKIGVFMGPPRVMEMYALRLNQVKSETVQKVEAYG